MKRSRHECAGCQLVAQSRMFARTSLGSHDLTIGIYLLPQSLGTIQ
jgi:hypothetical protein